MTDHPVVGVANHRKQVGSGVGIDVRIVPFKVLRRHMPPGTIVVFGFLGPRMLEGTRGTVRQVQAYPSNIVWISEMANRPRNVVIGSDRFNDGSAGFGNVHKLESFPLFVLYLLCMLCYVA